MQHKHVLLPDGDLKENTSRTHSYFAFAHCAAVKMLTFPGMAGLGADGSWVIEILCQAHGRSLQALPF